MSLLSRQKKNPPRDLYYIKLQNSGKRPHSSYIFEGEGCSLWTKFSLMTVGYSFSENFCKFFHYKCVGLKAL